MKEWVYVGLVTPAGHVVSTAQLTSTDCDCAHAAVIPMSSEHRSLWNCTLLNQLATAVWQFLKQGAAAQLILLKSICMPASNYSKLQ